MLYHLMLFAHIVGVLILFMSIGIQLAIVFGLRRAQTAEQARVWLRAAPVVARMFPLATLLILVAGISMVLTAWSILTAWVDVAFVAVLLLAMLGPVVTGARFKAVHQAAVSAPGGAPATGAGHPFDDPVLRGAALTMAAVTFGIVYLMVIKPDLLGSLVTMAVALALGGVLALLGRRSAAPVPVPVVARMRAIAPAEEGGQA